MKKLTAAELIAVHTVTEMTAGQALSNPREDPFSKEQIETFWYMAHDWAYREFGDKSDPDSADEVERVFSVVLNTMTRMCDP